MLMFIKCTEALCNRKYTGISIYAQCIIYNQEYKYTLNVFCIIVVNLFLLCLTLYVMNRCKMCLISSLEQQLPLCFSSLDHSLLLPIICNGISSDKSVVVYNVQLKSIPVVSFCLVLCEDSMSSLDAILLPPFSMLKNCYFRDIHRSVTLPF